MNAKGKRSRATEPNPPQTGVVTIPLRHLLRDLSNAAGPDTPCLDFTEAKAALMQMQKTFVEPKRHFREAWRRLFQIEWIVNRVWSLEAGGGGVQFHFGSSAKDERTMEVITLTESAYYFAFRLKRVIKEIGRATDTTCKNFDSKGVNSVRNQLIEHTDDPTYEFATGDADGPRLKPHDKYRKHKETFDRGLYVNIEEYLNDFSRRLRAAAENRDVSKSQSGKASAGGHTG
jgi:hypothetical protein